jgi:hypothetical protein
MQDIAGLIEAKQGITKKLMSFWFLTALLLLVRPHIGKNHFAVVFNCKVILTRPGEDLHSGLAGGNRLQNPLNVAGSIIGSLHDEN